MVKCVRNCIFLAQHILIYIVVQNSGGDDVQIFMPGPKSSNQPEVPAATQEAKNDAVVPAEGERFEKASSDMFEEPTADAFKPAKEGMYV